jgi:hypothetical protein
MMSWERIQFTREIVEKTLTPDERLLLIIELIGESTPSYLYKIIDDVLPLGLWPELVRKLDVNRDEIVRLATTGYQGWDDRQDALDGIAHLVG